MSDKRPEQSIASARASVMIYDDMNKKWVPSGTSHGLSKVHIYHHFLNNTFRVVGRKLQDHEVVINCAILKGLKYNQATPTFHQWRDNKQVYGLNFSSKDDAEIFAAAMLRSLDVLNTGGQLTLRAAPNPPAVGASPGAPNGQAGQPQPGQQQPNNRIMAQQQNQYEQYQQPQQHPVYQAPHQHHSANELYDMYDEYATGSHPNSNHYSDGGYDIYQQQQQQHHEAMEMDRRLSLQQQGSVSGLHQVHSSPNISQAPPAAPPAPPPAPPVSAPAPPAAPPAPPPPAAPPAPPVSGGGAPPPPPPPMPNFGGSGAGGGNEPVSGLAAALQAAKLRKTTPRNNENSGGSTTSSAGSSGYGSIGKGKEERPAMPPMASMMDEMQKTLARRRAKVERGEDDDSSGPGSGGRNFEKGSSPTGNKSSSSGSESPKPGRRRFGSTADEIDVTKLNGMAENNASGAGGTSATNAELEAMKQEILREMRKEMAKMKQDIIEAIRCEMNRR